MKNILTQPNLFQDFFFLTVIVFFNMKVRKYTYNIKIKN
jgi:hypothetical protein